MFGLLKQRRLFDDAFWALFGQLASAIALLAGTRILIELVTPESYGQVALLNGFVALGVAVFSYPFICAGMRLLPECRDVNERTDLQVVVSGLLVSGGVLACAVPNYHSFLVKLLGTKDNACLWVPEHVNYFTGNGLRALVERQGFQVVEMEQITRIPFNALSKRLRLKGRPAAVADALVKFLQTPFANLMNCFGMGIYINLYAVKQ